MSKTSRMPISLITDEYSNDPATAFELGKRWGINRFEIRYAYRFRVPVSPAWAAQRVIAAARDYDVEITGISPGLFKPTMAVDGTMTPIDDDTPGEIRRHLDELLPAAFNFAESLGTRNITLFALPRRRGDRRKRIPAVVTDTLAEAAEIAASENFRLLLENNAGSWAGTGAQTAEILDAVESPHLHLVWDPANAAMTDPTVNPVTNGYPLVAGRVANVHVKDMIVRGGKGIWAQLGEGVIKWTSQLRRLAKDGYTGPLTLEPHLQYLAGANTNLVAQVHEFVKRMRRLLRSI